MSAGHTPGPWETRIEKPPGLNVTWKWVAPVNWTTRVCRVVLYTGEEAEQEANARLIAAAPDLLEAALPALHELDVVIQLVTSDQTRAEMQAVANNLRAAIAKATGQ